MVGRPGDNTWVTRGIMVTGGEWHQECRDAGTSASYPERLECQKTRNNCLNKKIFVWNTLDTLQRQDHVKSSSSQMLFIFYILKSKWIFHFAWHDMAATVRVVFSVLIQVYPDRDALSILTNAVMISGLVINTVNQMPPLPAALQQIKSHEVSLPHSSNCRQSVPSWPWIL